MFRVDFQVQARSGRTRYQSLFPASFSIPPSMPPLETTPASRSSTCRLSVDDASWSDVYKKIGVVLSFPSSQSLPRFHSSFSFFRSYELQFVLIQDQPTTVRRPCFALPLPALKYTIFIPLFPLNQQGRNEPERVKSKFSRSTG